MAKKNLTG